MFEYLFFSSFISFLISLGLFSEPTFSTFCLLQVSIQLFQPQFMKGIYFFQRNEFETITYFVKLQVHHFKEWQVHWDIKCIFVLFIFAVVIFNFVALITVGPIWPITSRYYSCYSNTMILTWNLIFKIFFVEFNFYQFS